MEHLFPVVFQDLTSAVLWVEELRSAGIWGDHWAKLPYKFKSDYLGAVEFDL